MELLKKQIKQFNEDGFLILRNFAPESFCDKILIKAKKHLENKQAPIESEQEYTQKDDKDITVRRLRQVYDREEIFRKWMTNKKIYPILKTLLNDTPILTLAHHNSIMTKMPHESSRTHWHQDRRYWNFENDNLISVWLSLDDEYLENGLLEFIPKSHNLTFEKESFDENSNFLDSYKKNQKLIKTAVHKDLKKGDVVLFHCKTLHHANKNTTNNPKISFVYTARGLLNKAIEGTRSYTKEINLDKIT